MYTVRIGKTLLRADFGFLALIALLSLSGRSAAVMGALCCCLVHEGGHLAMMRAFERPVGTVTFYAGGISIRPRGQAVGGSREDILILLAGPGANLLAAAAAGATGLGELAYYNMALGVLNLLPMSYFDGGRLLCCLFGGAAARAVRAGFLLACSMGLLWGSVRGAGNLSLSLTLLFACAYELESIRGPENAGKLCVSLRNGPGKGQVWGSID